MVKVVAVRYCTRTGNTKKVAEAIAEELGCEAKDVSEPIQGKVDLLFLGASVYAGGIDPAVKNFLQTLSKEQVGRIAVFSTSAGTKQAYSKIRQEADAAGIPVEPENFYCHGQFHFVHRGHPNEEDLAAAKKFAREVALQKK